MAKRILVVDDEPDLLKVAAFRLKKSGYEVLIATDGQLALDLLKTNTPDLILLDLVLPKVNGEQVLNMIKDDERLQNIPVILFTASVERIKKMAADDYLIKPFETKDLLEKVKKFIG
jgi:two-component system alkaline phosphatase synthesis response regulator PhoP